MLRCRYRPSWKEPTIRLKLLLPISMAQIAGCVSAVTRAVIQVRNRSGSAAARNNRARDTSAAAHRIKWQISTAHRCPFTGSFEHSAHVHPIAARDQPEKRHAQLERNQGTVGRSYKRMRRLRPPSGRPAPLVGSLLRRLLEGKRRCREHGGLRPERRRRVESRASGPRLGRVVVLPPTGA